MKRALLASGLSLFAAGCASVPNENLTKDVSVKDIVARIECELIEAYPWIKDKLPAHKTWAVGYTISYVDERTFAAAPNVSTGIPFNLHKAFGAHLSVEEESRGLRKLSVKYVAQLAALSKTKCQLPTGGHPLAGELHIVEPLKEALSATQDGRASQVATKDISYRIEIGLKTSADSGIGLTFYRIPHVGIGFRAVGERTYTVDLAFADETPAPAAEPLRVIVVGTEGRQRAVAQSVAAPRQAAPARGISEQTLFRIDSALQRLRPELRNVR